MIPGRSPVWKKNQHRGSTETERSGLTRRSLAHFEIRECRLKESPCNEGPRTGLSGQGPKGALHIYMRSFSLGGNYRYCMKDLFSTAFLILKQKIVVMCLCIHQWGLLVYTIQQ